jgi:hypothetical protein
MKTRSMWVSGIILVLVAAALIVQGTWLGPNTVSIAIVLGLIGIVLVLIARRLRKIRAATLRRMVPKAEARISKPKTRKKPEKKRKRK